jgi:hypothetical protein
LHDADLVVDEGLDTDDHLHRIAEGGVQEPTHYRRAGGRERERRGREHCMPGSAFYG